MMHTVPTSLQGLRVNEIGKGAFTRTVWYTLHKSA